MNAITDGQVICPLYDPRFERELRTRFARPVIAQLALANRLSLSTGRWPAKGWLLVLKQNLDQLNLYSTDMRLVISDPALGDLSLGALTAIGARCVSRGNANDPSSVYLLEVTDRRGVLSSPWFSVGTTNYYNVPAPAYPGQYYIGSTDGGVAWTWSRLVEDLWTQMPLLGGFPGLPSAPSGTPESWWFPGTSCWHALCDVLDYLGMEVAVDLTIATPYTIVSGGAADPSFDALSTRFAGRLEDEQDYINPGAGRVPGTVVVYFHRRNQYYGTEETVRSDSLQWLEQPLYSVMVTAPAPYDASPAVHHLWDDFTVRYDVNGLPLAADTLTAAALASQKVEQYFNRIYSSTLGSMMRTYAGALPFATGSQVDGVRWRQDFSHRDRMGWVTEATRGYDPAWEEVGTKPYGKA